MDWQTTVALLIYFAIGAVLFFYTKIQQKKNPEQWAPVILDYATLQRIKEERAAQNKAAEVQS